MGPLQGVKIIDMTSVLMGPYATQMLGDYGADVIKVESPEGDIIRADRPGPQSRHGTAVPQLQSQQALDRARPEAAGRSRRPARSWRPTADVLVYNVRPEAMARLKLGYDDVAADQPAHRLRRAVRLRPGRSLCGKARLRRPDAGKLRAVAPDRARRRRRAALRADGARRPRRRPHRGRRHPRQHRASRPHRQRPAPRRADVRDHGGFVLGDHLGGLTYDPPLDQGGYARHLSKDRRPYATADGFISVIVYTDKQWTSFFDATKRDDLRNDPRFATFHGRLANIDRCLWRARPHLRDAHHRGVDGAADQGRYSGDADAYADQHSRRPAPEGGRLLPDGRASERRVDPQHATDGHLVGYAGRNASASRRAAASMRWRS